MALPQVLDTTDGLQIWRVTVSFWNKANMMMMMMIAAASNMNADVQHIGSSHFSSAFSVLVFKRRGL